VNGIPINQDLKYRFRVSLLLFDRGWDIFQLIKCGLSFEKSLKKNFTIFQIKKI
jgi:hypothetical protein